MAGVNPLQAQGMLNRVLTNIVVADYPQLNVLSPFMSKSLAQLSFDSAAVDQIATATGIVNSPAPFIMANLVINLLRSQAVPALYIAQYQLNAMIGTVTAYTDSTAMAPFKLANCSIMDIDPGTFDGQDPTTKVTIKGVYYVNAALWANV